MFANSRSVTRKNTTAEGLEILRNFFISQTPPRFLRDQGDLNVRVEHSRLQILGVIHARNQQGSGGPVCLLLVSCFES
jgi:hypothetical protein